MRQASMEVASPNTITVRTVEKKTGDETLTTWVFCTNGARAVSVLDFGPFESRAGHFRYFFIFSIKNYFFAFFIKLITYFCTSPI